MTIESLSPLDNLDVHYRQAISPNHQTGSFVGDDTDNHDFVFQGRGKSCPQIDIHNAPNKELTWTLYGMHEKDGEVGDPGTYQIDTGAVDAAGQYDDAWFGYAFPFFLLRLAYAVVPDDDPFESVTVFANLTFGI
ncbi:MAG: hypothetical protein WC329_01620 [Candidatus Omnitrophota bacterium]|jgi:hypothetical protein